MPRTVSIRRSVLVNLVVLIVLLSIAIQTTMGIGARRAVRTLSEGLITRSIDQSESQLRRFFGPVSEGIHIAKAWGEEGLLDTDRPETINDVLVPLMERYSQISSIMVADSRGREHMVLRVGDAWSTRRTRRDEWDRRTHWLEWSDTQPVPVTVWREIDYDPRRRPWFRKAVEAHGEAAPDPAGMADTPVQWTNPYIFFTTKDPGITASVAFEPPDADGTVEHVIAFDLLLNDISEFTTALRPSRNGFAFVLTEVGELIGLPREELFAGSEHRNAALLRSPTEVDIPVIRDGMLAYARQEESERGAYRFKSDGQWWWAGGRPFFLGADRELLMAVGVPEFDLLGSVTVMRVWIIGITAALLAAALWRAVVLARRYSRPIEALVAQSHQIRRGNLDPGPPVKSSLKEIRMLAKAHDRMRVGLAALMKLERDLLLARQIQERTFPERLPALKGFQLDAWSEPADETGGDTYDVIGYRTAPAGKSIVLTTEHADRAVLLMADATGHGIGPALSVTQVRAMLRMAVRAGQELPSIARHLNEQLFADLPDGRFITAWLGLLDVRGRTLTSFSAGQAPLLRYDAKGDAFDIIDADTVPLGVMEKIDTDVGAPIRIRPGDLFATISDGIFEAAAPGGELFGTERVVEVLRAHRGETPGKIIEALREAVAEFTQGAPATDDRTGIIIKGG